MRETAGALLAAALLVGSPGLAVDREEPPPYRKVLLPGLVRVRFVAGVTAADVEPLLRALGVWAVRRGEDYWVVRAGSAAGVGRAVRGLNASPMVEWAVPHYVLVQVHKPPHPRRPQVP